MSPYSWGICKNNLFRIMKKYKNKKTGEVAYEQPDHYALNGDSIPKRFVEDSQDWDLIEYEPNFKILELNIEGKIYKIVEYPDRTWNGYKIYYWSLDLLLKKFPNSIHSIMRLSDGKIFTVGDIIDGKFFKCKKITKFSIKNDIFKDTKLIKIHQERGICNLQDIKHSKEPEPLFITEDGVPIYKGMQTTILYKEGMSVGNTRHFCGNNKDFLYFSTKEAAQKYVDEHKPLLTTEAAQKYVDEHKPLLTTEDGVHIYKGDSFWELLGKTNSIYKVSPESINAFLDIVSKDKCRKAFSTKEAAQKYVGEQIKEVVIYKGNIYQ